MDAAFLTIDAVRLRFGGVTALDEVSLQVERGEIFGVIGPNGAGKTSLFNCLTRFYQPDAGAVRLDGVDLLRQPAHRLARLGVARTFQNLALFPSLTVRDTIAVGAHARVRSDPLSEALGLPRARRAEAAIAAIVDAMLARFELGDVADAFADTLPLAARKRVDLARALAAAPRLLLLDEPAAGLAPEQTAALARRLRALRDASALTILLVEHNMRLVAGLCDRVAALDQGRVVTVGTPEQVARHSRVREAYLGGADINARADPNAPFYGPGA